MGIKEKLVGLYTSIEKVWDGRKCKLFLIIQGSKQYVSHGGLIYNLIQELGVSRLTQRDCPFKMETPATQLRINAITTE